MPAGHTARFLAVTEGTHSLPVVDRRPTPVPPDDLYRLARLFAEAWAQSMERAAPGIFTKLLPGIDLRPAYIVATTLRLGQVNLPRLISYLEVADRTEPIAIVDLGLDGRQVLRAERRLRRRFGRRRVHFLSAQSTVGLRKAADLIETSLSERRSLEGVAGSDVLAIVGTHRELPALSPVIDALEAGSLAILPKTSSPEAERAAHQLAEREQATLLPVADTLSWDSPLARKAVESLRKVQGEIRQLGPLMVTRMLPLLRMVRHSTILAAALGAAQPRVVVGSFDRTPTGALLRHAARTSGCKPAIIDLQHGTLLPFHIVDLMDFDLVLAWNEASRSLLDRESRGKLRSIAVVGNPLWDTLAEDNERMPGPLREWASKYSIIAYFPQPPKGAYLTSQTMLRVMRELTEVVTNIPGTALLVRPHERDEEAAFDPGIVSLHDRVRIVEEKEADLATVLRLARVAVSVYSTALADARAAGVPAVSFDPAGIAPRLGLDFADEVSFCRTQDELAQAIRIALSSHAPPPSSRVIPSFDRPYRDRIRGPLQHFGLASMGGSTAESLNPTEDAAP